MDLNFGWGFTGARLSHTCSHNTDTNTDIEMLYWPLEQNTELDGWGVTGNTILLSLPSPSILSLNSPYFWLTAILRGRYAQWQPTKLPNLRDPMTLRLKTCTKEWRSNWSWPERQPYSWDGLWAYREKFRRGTTSRFFFLNFNWRL